VKDALTKAGDFTLRLAFFAVAPLGIVIVSALFPVTGALVTIGLALVVFLFGEAVRGLAKRRPILEKLLKGQLAFEAYYREHKPRPFLYYVFYPLLFPYWLAVKKARDEFLLFKGYTLFSLVMLVGGAAWQYFTAWRPELGPREFFVVLVAQVVVETLLVLMLVMPIVTTVVHFHAEGAKWRLAAVLAIGLLSSGVAIARLEHRRDPIVSFSTRERVGMRTAKNVKASREVEAAALKAAWKVLANEKDDVDRDGKVLGEALDAAHAALTAFYKKDEAYAFDLWLSRSKGRELLVVYFEARRGRQPIFLAMDRKGREVTDAKQLPKGALGAMKHAADGVIER
jgi:hypothetical protein